MKLIKLLLLAILFLSLFASCDLFKLPEIVAAKPTEAPTETPTPEPVVVGTPTESPEPTTTPGSVQNADELVEQGIAALKDQDWNLALTKFSQAVIINPDNGAALLGYSFVNLASMASDSDVVDLMHDNLGFVDYPVEMKDILIGSNWIQEWTSTYENTYWDEDGNEYTDMYSYSQYFPRIANQEDFDGIGISGPADGVVDLSEVMVAFTSHFMTHNLGLTGILDKVLPVFEERLNDTYEIISKASPDMKFTLSWDMVSDDEPVAGESTWWPLYDENGEPLPLVIGKDEILLEISGLKMFQALANLTKAYDMSLSLEDYWNVYNPKDGTLDPTGLEKPFSSFLRLTDEAEDAYAETKAILIEALGNIVSSLEKIEADRAGFTLSTDPEVGYYTEEQWNEIFNESNYNYQLRVYKELLSSLEENKTVSIPTSYYHYEEYGWDGAIENGSSVTVNAGLLFGTPLNLLASLLSLSESGEPEIFVLDKNDGEFDVLDAAGFEALYPDYDMRNYNPEAVFYYYIPDITFGSAFPINNIPVDDPSTGMNLQYFNWQDYNQNNYDVTTSWNNLWEPGEEIYSFSFEPVIEGAIDLDRLSEYPDNDPFYTSAFENFDISSISDEMLSMYTTSENYSALRLELENALYNGIGYINRAYIPAFISGDSVYMSIYFSSDVLFNLVTPEGTTGIDLNGEPITSFGSIYWYLLDIFNRGLTGELFVIETEMPDPPEPIN